MVAILLEITTSYTEDTVYIYRHKETQNSYKHDLEAPPSTRRIRDETTNLCLAAYAILVTQDYIYIKAQSNPK